ncbi:sigma-54 interaction domain-containing protein [Acinetobacter rudis]|uniref:Sigma-54 dependent transcriptional regulator n=1 Tax=Acinetobacter rudis TaxID=632955 RepID=A0AAW8JAW8_9GAMM|nr:sigma-54 dependent transcriptional regulator [Acinetobacter rudis]MDQ8936240.1 sigma-54 dependent transcriptional regulator [Acinetobacter rudis]MDQ8953954.1 sigma-54 dependent transcriptional regulator [Acinetobacter rudis]MDQ9018503.1 sigma-54 dependent transcriptional regulator [Acinetobacter rudis]
MDIVKHPESRQLARTVKASAYVFEDQNSKRLMSYISQIAPSEATVLIIGETGTGKELVARQIHQHSHRRQQPFIAVNCGALSDTLAETELFGHEKGAFTGAISQQMGWFEAAEGGTIFLDEIGDLSPNIQVKLLRILQENEIVRVGSRKTKKIDVRVIAATNIRLEEAVYAGNFREDLYFRLKVASLSILPLRLRIDDILPLAQHFIEDYSMSLKRPPAVLTTEAQQLLCEYHWPGNIRELENAIHHALLICKNGLIQSYDFQLSGFKHKLLSNVHDDLIYQANHGQSLKQTLLAWFEQGISNLDERLEAEITQAAYEYCHKNQLHTAKLLGVSRNIIRARLIRHGFLEPNIRA